MLAGVDVSGDQQSGNHKFMGLVIGTDASINDMIANLGPRPIHMSRLCRADQDAVMDGIAFDGVSCMGLCACIEKKRVISRIAGRFNRGQNFKNHKKLLRMYNAVLWSMLRERVDAFLYAHRFEPGRLCLQCDFDCRDFVKDQGWQYTNHGPAHELADALAWGNRRGQEPDGAMRLPCRPN